MKKAPLITAIVAILALAGVLVAFVNNASVFVTVAQAKVSSGDRLQLYGEIVKDSVTHDLTDKAILFRLKDPTGATVMVRHVGEPPENMATATHIVAVGSMKGNEFLSTQLLIKCPSKYEGVAKPTSVAQN